MELCEIRNLSLSLNLKIRDIPTIRLERWRSLENFAE